MRLLILVFLAFASCGVTAAPLTSRFTYQGSLEFGGAPVNGTVDLAFEPFSAVTSGSALAAPLQVDDVVVDGGVFTTVLDFGDGFFVGDRVFLQIGVRDGASTGAFTTLTPRQEITAAPYAQTALQALGGSVLPTGVVLAIDSTTLPEGGWVWSDGRTIGSASSGATNRANADTLALYRVLWTAFDNAVLPIETSAGLPTTRGASADADFAANKRLPVPDRRGRANVGLDTMGGAAANRLTLGVSGIDGALLGASGGAQAQTLSVAQLPSHAHTGITLPASEDDNPDPPFSGSVIGNNLAGSATTYATAATGSAGGGQAHPNVQPSIVTSFIVKL
ncbi:MAG: hypothetical protein JNN30_05455 [Rhodanobacteraceae bacterium]|nr:hypothetical protein [Rhodanobacteraceae bacterium]